LLGFWPWTLLFWWLPMTCLSFWGEWEAVPPSLSTEVRVFNILMRELSL
jgi:hypothetical protein